MPTKSSSNRFQNPLFALVMPVLLLALGVWQITRITGSAEDFLANASQIEGSIERIQPLATREPNAVIHFRNNVQSYTAAEGLALLQSERTDQQRNASVERARMVAAWVTAGAGAVTLLAVLCCLATANIGAWRGRRSRAALISAFRIVVRVLPFLLGCVAIGLAVAVTAAVLFEGGAIWFVERLDGGAIKALLVGFAFAFLTIAVAVNSIRQLIRTLAAFTPTPMLLMGRAVGPDTAPGLWAFLHQIAAKQGATAPDNIVVGMKEGFFVTSSAIRLLPENRVVTGRSLYVPAPYLPLLSQGETGAIIAHELAHFMGEDTAYSQQFLPLYASMSLSMDAVSATGRSTTWADATFKPAAVLAWHVMDSFSHTVAHWSRLREFEADRGVLRAWDAHFAATALIRTSIGGDIIHGALVEMYNQPARADVDLVATVIARANEAGFTKPASHLEDRLPHPTDTHPPTRQRIEALGLPVDDALLAVASRPLQVEDTEFADALFTDWLGLRKTLGGDVLKTAEIRDSKVQAKLEETANAVTTDVSIFESGRTVVVKSIVVGCIMILFAVIIVPVALNAGRVVDANSQLTFIGISASALLICALLVTIPWLRWRRTKAGPFLVVSSKGFRCLGFAGMVPWSAVDRIKVTAGQRSFITTFYFNATWTLPEQTAYRWTMKLNRSKRLLRLDGYMPKGMTPQAYLDILYSGLNAFRAAAALRERAGM